MPNIMNVRRFIISNFYFYICKDITKTLKFKLSRFDINEVIAFQKLSKYFNDFLRFCELWPMRQKSHLKIVTGIIYTEDIFFDKYKMQISIKNILKKTTALWKPHKKLSYILRHMYAP